LPYQRRKHNAHLHSWPREDQDRDITRGEKLILPDVGMDATHNLCAVYKSADWEYRMNNRLRLILIIILSYSTASCAPVELHPDNQPVRLIFYNEINLAKILPECTYIGPVVSSYGHWYNYMFISNMNMTHGAIDDMYNKANELGANVVYINKNIDFTTSVTLLGQAYRCTE
jgi:hypothetical protein